MRSILIAVVVTIFMREVMPSPVSVMKTDDIIDSNDRISAKGLVSFLNYTIHALAPGFLQNSVNNLFANVDAHLIRSFPVGDAVARTPFPYYSFSAFIPFGSPGKAVEVKN